VIFSIFLIARYQKMKMKGSVGLLGQGFEVPQPVLSTTCSGGFGTRSLVVKGKY